MYISFVKFIEYTDMLKCKLMLTENSGSRVCDRRCLPDSECQFCQQGASHLSAARQRNLQRQCQ